MVRGFAGPFRVRLRPRISSGLQTLVPRSDPRPNGCLAGAVGLDMIGARLGHYLILERIGSGGMGVVYRARDEHLERDVAIKVLPASTLAVEDARRQFRKEALALSKLNHPNIETVHDFDSRDGVDFLVLELLRGESLDERIGKGPMPEREACRLGEQLSAGLGAAHAAGVLHRDIKPGNLHVDAAGRLKILDFGLAKSTRTATAGATETLTDSAQIAGTLPYMAPEQLEGGKLDQRTDIYSAGAVLYEMICGRRPFAQETQAALVSAILALPAASPRELVPGISAELERIVLKCLEKDPADRYQSAVELAVDLRHVALPGASHPAQERATQRRHRRRKRYRFVPVAIGVGVFLVLAAMVGLDVGGVRSRFARAGGTAPLALAVLPLVNLTQDASQEYFADGMTDELITKLAGVAALRVISRSSVMQYKGKNVPLRDIGKTLGVGMIVEGAVLRAGDVVRITAKLVEVASGRNVWGESFERNLSNVLALQSEVALAIVEKVRVHMTPHEHARLAVKRTVDPAAHEAYLEGRFYLNQYSSEASRKALALFQSAIEIDPGFAQAHAGLADAYVALAFCCLPTAEAMPRSRAAASMALTLDPELAAALATLAYVRGAYDWEWEAAERDFSRAIALNPSEVTAHQNYGGLLTVLGRFDEAIDEFARARAIDPMSSTVATMSLWPLFEGRRFEQAIASARSLVEADPRVSYAHMILGQALFLDGEREAGIAALQKAIELDPANPFPHGWLGFAHAVNGDRDAALDVLESLHRREADGYVQPYLFALVYVGLGDHDQALDWLEKAYEARSDEMPMIKVDPAMDPLRSDPRFQSILHRMNL